MISYIEGTIIKIDHDSLIVLTGGGIGFRVFVPISVFREVSSVGHEIYLYTYLQVKEDGMSLFGFLDESELEVFKKLITVSGVGPKLAMAIMSALSVQDLTYAVISGDAKTIATAQGVGKKMAEKIIVELKDSFSGDFSVEQNDAGGYESIQAEAVEALSALGYSASEAMRAVRTVKITDDMSVEDVVRLSLKEF